MPGLRVFSLSLCRCGAGRLAHGRAIESRLAGCLVLGPGWADGGDFTCLEKDFFGAITGAISLVLDGLSLRADGNAVAGDHGVILLLAWQLAGPRVAIFTAAALAYLAVLGFWEKSLETVALLGTAAILCLVIGIPLGIWCGRRPRVYTTLRPVLDFMQTMPAFVYLIPVIATVRHWQATRRHSHADLRHAACRALDRAWPARCPFSHSGSSASLWRHEMVYPDTRGPSARDAVDHGWDQPDDPDVPFDGCHRIADRREGPRRGCAERPSIRRRGAGSSGRLRDPAVRHDHRPDRAGTAWRASVALSQGAP